MHKVKVVKEAGDMLRFVLRDCNAMLFIRDPWSDMEHFTMALIRDHLIEKYGNIVFYEVERHSTFIKPEWQDALFIMKKNGNDLIICHSRDELFTV